MKEFKLFATLIQVAFIVMKLCGAIDWSWGLVMSPIIAFLAWMVFRFVFTIFYVKHEIKKSHDNLHNRMVNLRKLQQEQQAKLNGVKTIGLEFVKDESDRFVLDWYLRSGYKPFDKKSNLLIKELKD